MGWDHILLIILNKLFLPVLSRVGVQSVFFSISWLSVLIGVRCIANVADLDAPAGQRSHDTLLDALTLKELWDKYGIVGDLLVGDLKN